MLLSFGKKVIHPKPNSYLPYQRLGSSSKQHSTYKISNRGRFLIFSSFVFSGVSCYYVLNDFTKATGVSINVASSVLGKSVVYKYLSDVLCNYFGFLIVWDQIELINGKLAVKNLKCAGKSTSTSPCSFNFSIDSVDLELSLKKLLLEQTGLIKQFSADGIIGTISQDEYFDYASGLVQRFPYVQNSLSINDIVKMTNLKIYFKYPKPFKSFYLKVDEATLPKFSSYSFLYDVLQAYEIKGEYDGSSFIYTIPSSNEESNDPDSQNNISQQFRSLRIDNVSIAHFQEDSSGKGIFSILSNGYLDINAVLYLPSIFSNQMDTVSVARRILSEGRISSIPKLPFQNDSEVISIEEAILNALFKPRSLGFFRESLSTNNSSIPVFPINSPSTTIFHSNSLSTTATVNISEKLHNSIGFYLDVTLKNLCLIDPIPKHYQLTSKENLFLKFITESKTPIPLFLSFDMNRTDFNGVWTPFNSGLTRHLQKSFTYSLSDYFINEKRSFSFYFRFGAWSTTLFLLNCFNSSSPQPLSLASSSLAMAN